MVDEADDVPLHEPALQRGVAAVLADVGGIPVSYTERLGAAERAGAEAEAALGGGAWRYSNRPPASAPAVPRSGSHMCPARTRNCPCSPNRRAA